MCPWDLFRHFKVCSDAKEDWGAENNGKLPHLFIPSKTAILVPEFAVEDMPLDRTATLVPAMAVKDVRWAENSDDDLYSIIRYTKNFNINKDCVELYNFHKHDSAEIASCQCPENQNKIYLLSNF